LPDVGGFELYVTVEHVGTCVVGIVSTKLTWVPHASPPPELLELPSPPEPVVPPPVVTLVVTLEDDVDPAVVATEELVAADEELAVDEELVVDDEALPEADVTLEDALALVLVEGAPPCPPEPPSGASRGVCATSGAPPAPPAPR
jgi:hypothetical protein